MIAESSGDDILSMIGRYKVFYLCYIFAIQNKPLYAIASGIVIGMGNEAVHDNYIVAKYGK